MKIILAPQALKGSLDAEAVGQAMAEGVRTALPDAEIAIILPKPLDTAEIEQIRSMCEKHPSHPRADLRW